MHKRSTFLVSFSIFVLLTFGISWAFWIPAALQKQELMTSPTIVLHTLGGFGPSLAGIWMVYRRKDRQAWRDFWRRTIDFRQVGVRGMLLILAFFPLVTLFAIGLSYLVGAHAHPLSTLQRIAVNPILLIVMLLGGLVSGPISEELGWRGYALDILNDRRNPLKGSVVLGLFWSVWHLPLFFIQGTIQNGLGLHTLDFWLFILTPIPLSALFAWVYYQTGRSILSAILMHLGFNFTANLLYPLSPQASLIQAALFLLLMALAQADQKHRQSRLPDGILSRLLPWRNDQ